ncbi:MAG TPA: HNH endonuclease signature motif containing protein [Elusimicrobiota bacterium]|nr:HNH endonuclease signature motif containing protein [Elusimicrobiota bacterium]
MELKKILEEFQDFLAPRLDTYEQAIYLYIFRHSCLIGLDEVVIGFKSARKRMACGIGEKGKPMSESTAYEKLQSLQSKGCIEILDSTREGRKIRLKLPAEIPGVILAKSPASNPPVLEEIDFFLPQNRQAILSRENDQCFYCLRKLNPQNYVIEHVVSRPEGNNSYKNVVAACRQCNNRKNDTPVEDFLRLLLREDFLSAEDHKQRMGALNDLRVGNLKPALDLNG